MYLLKAVAGRIFPFEVVVLAVLRFCVARTSAGVINVSCEFERRNATATFVNYHY